MIHTPFFARNVSSEVYSSCNYSITERSFAPKTYGQLEGIFRRHFRCRLTHDLTARWHETTKRPKLLNKLWKQNTLYPVTRNNLLKFQNRMWYIIVSFQHAVLSIADRYTHFSCFRCFECADAKVVKTFPLLPRTLSSFHALNNRSVE